MFIESLLKEVENAKKTRGIFPEYERIKNSDKVYIFGTGVASAYTSNALRKNNFDVYCYADNNPDKIGKTFLGKKIISPKDIKNDGIVIIESNVKNNIHTQLDEMGIKNYIYIDPHYLNNLEVTPPRKILEILLNESKSINKTAELINDNHSLKVFKNILLHRVVHNMNLLWEVYEENQYFGNSVIKNISGSFVDCGAYNGDTLKQFLNQINNQDYKYFAIEADTNNYNELKEYVIEHNLSCVYPINLGVWDEKCELAFENNSISGAGAGSISNVKSEGNGSLTIKVDSIDNIIQNDKVDFIKMDIEGSEINALYGAEKIIKRDLPILAISAYHKLEHLWEVPLLINSFSADYEIKYAHHMWNMDDSVCYAIKKK